MPQTWFFSKVTLLRALSASNSNCARAAACDPLNTHAPRHRDCKQKTPPAYPPRFKNGGNKHNRWCNGKEAGQTGSNKVLASRGIFCGLAEVNVKKKKKNSGEKKYLHSVFFKVPRPKGRNCAGVPRGKRRRKEK